MAPMSGDQRKALSTRHVTLIGADREPGPLARDALNASGHWQASQTTVRGVNPGLTGLDAR